MRDIGSLRVRRFVEYWHDKRAGHPMPARADIDPVDLPQVLEILLIADVLRDPLAFRFRLFGTALTVRAGRDPTGHLLDRDLHGPAAAEELFRLYAAVADGAAPLTGTSPTFWPDREWIQVEWAILPLGRDRRLCDQIIVCSEEVGRSTVVRRGGVCYAKARTSRRSVRAIGFGAETAAGVQAGGTPLKASK